VRVRPALTKLLVVLLLLQWGTAFGHCLRLAGAAGQGLTVELCTADGLRHVTIPAEDGDRGDHAAAGPLCPACAGPGAFALPAPEAALAPPAVAVAAAEPPAPAPSPFRQPPHPGQPRAPPAT
jgi:hypothetical protein